MSGRIRVLIWYRCPPDKLDSFIETFHAISTQLAGVPGLLRSDLLQARREEGSVVLMSAWESAEAFATWEASARHRPTGAPLREYADTSRPYQFELYQILAPHREPSVAGPLPSEQLDCNYDHYHPNPKKGCVRHERQRRPGRRWQS